MNKYCVYTSADNNYALYAAVSLLSFREHNKGVDLYLLSSKLSDKTKNSLNRLNINYIELDMEKIFYKTWDYPIECYYIFCGPELFYEKGYEYSVYMDGDVLCRKNILQNIDFSKIDDYAGVSAGDIKVIFNKDYPVIQKIWKLEETSKHRINSGVVYFNNKAMVDIKLLNKVGELFNKSIHADIPRKGDDSLFALFQLVFYVGKQPHIINNIHNYIPCYNDNPDPNIMENIIFYHFGGKGINKPWFANAYNYTDDANKIYGSFVDEWRVYAKKYMGLVDYNRTFSKLPPRNILDTLIRKLLLLKQRIAD